MHAGERVRVRGLATASPQAFSDRYALFYVQDDHAGIAVFYNGSLAPRFSAGAIVEASGRVEQFNGQPQIKADWVRVAGSGMPPPPLEVEGHEVNSPRFSGRLVQVEGAVTSFHSRSGTIVYLAVANRTSVRVYISKKQEAALLSKFRKGDVVRVAGIASQFDPEPPYRSGWQIRPRSPADVTIVTAPRLDRGHLLTGALVLAGTIVLALIWILTLRHRVRAATASLAETIAVLHAQRQASPAAILVIDRADLVKDFNGRFLEMWGLSAEAVSSARLDAIFSVIGDCGAMTTRLREIEAGTANSGDLALSDGRIIAAARTPLQDGSGALWTFQDMTERELMREQIARNARVESLGRLAAAIAHEFNNVLMAIRPHAEILHRRCPEQGATIEKILSAVDRGRRTTSDVLSLTRPIELEKVNVRISDLLKDLQSELEGTLQPGVQVLFQEAETDATAALDRAHMMQVFLNIALNAQQAMNGSGQLRVTGSLTHRTTYPFGVLPSEAEYVHFQFEDNGPGIPPGLIDRVFEPLFSTKKRHGSGLGLAIGHGIVKAHDGNIFVESVPGKFTRFHIFIPLSNTSQDDERNAEAVPEWEGRHVLIVEDDLEVADAVATILGEAGHRVEHVVTGGEAIKAVETRPPQIAIIDLDLPDISGEEVYAAIVARWPHLPVILSSGHRDRLDLDSQKASSASFLPKPYDSATLFAEIERLCSKPAAAPPLPRSVGMPSWGE